MTRKRIPIISCNIPLGTPETQERTTLRRAQAKCGIRAKKTAQIASKHLIYPELVNECKKTGKEDAWRMFATKYTYERNGEEDG